MSYKIKAWVNSGFTATNVPDSEDTLDASAGSTTFRDLSILTSAWLSDVVVSATKDQVSLIDYVKIWDPDDTTPYSTWYYYVPRYTPLSRQTQKLTLVPVYALIGGGVSNIDFITGILTRKSPDKDQLLYGTFADDEYMRPAQPMRIRIEPLPVDPDSTTTNDSTFTRLTATRIDLGAQAYCNDIVIPIKNTVTDVSGETTTISRETVGGGLTYQTFLLDATTKIGIQGTGNALLSDNLIPYALYMGNSAFIDRGITHLRQMGAEGAIIASYMVPSVYIGTTETQATFSGTGQGTDSDGDTCKGMYYGLGDTLNLSSATFVPYARTTGESLFTTTYIKTIYSNPVTYTGGNTFPGVGSNLDPMAIFDNGKYHGYSVTNQCLCLGQYNKMGIITDGNNRCEYNPEELIDWNGVSSDDSLISSNQYVSIKAFPDIRYDGKPYYTYTRVHNNEVGFNEAVLWGAAGAQWQNYPISWTDVSGGKIAENQYKQSVSNQQLAFAHSRQGLWNRGINDLMEAFGGDAIGNSSYAVALGDTLKPFAQAANVGSQAALSTGVTGYPLTDYYRGQMLSQSLSGMSTGLSSYGAGVQGAETYAMEQATELANYMASINVQIPQVSFAPQANILRDTTGASAFAYRLEYGAEDVFRIDLILTSFGWKTCVVPKKADLTAHTTFDYLEGSVQVKSASSTPFPKWLADGISAEISAGVRIWHQAPITITADCNPIKEDS